MYMERTSCVESAFRSYPFVDCTNTVHGPYISSGLSRGHGAVYGFISHRLFRWRVKRRCPEEFMSGDVRRGNNKRAYRRARSASVRRAPRGGGSALPAPYRQVAKKRPSVAAGESAEVNAVVALIGSTKKKVLVLWQVQSVVVS